MLTIQQAHDYEYQFSRYADWLTVKTYFEEVFGVEKAAKARIVIEMEHGEDGPEYRIDRILAYDDEGKRIRVDTTTDFMRDVLKDLPSDEIITERELLETIQEFQDWSELPNHGESETYDLRTMPPIPDIVAC